MLSNSSNTVFEMLTVYKYKKYTLKRSTISICNLYNTAGVWALPVSDIYKGILRKGSGRGRSVSSNFHLVHEDTHSCAVLSVVLISCPPCIFLQQISS